MVIISNKKRIPEYKKLKECINISATTNQKKEIEKRAETEEITVSEYARNILFPK